MSSLESQDLALINPQYQTLLYCAMGATGGAFLGVCCPWESVRIVGMTLLTGVSYGVVNDMIACRECIEYFTVGHEYDGRHLRNCPLQTLDPNLNALVSMGCNCYMGAFCSYRGIVCPFCKNSLSW